MAGAGFVRVDCDYSAEGLWDERGTMFRIDSFPLSADLKARILRWQEHFTDHAKPWEAANAFDWEAHDAEGEAMAALVKQELPDWTVVAGDRLVLTDGSMGERVPFPGEALLSTIAGARLKDKG